MAAFNFPNSPSTNDVHTENGVSWKWNGTVWKKVASPDTIAKADSKVQVVDAGTGGYITAETDGTQRLRIQNSGAIVTGILTATSFKGDGSALTGITGTTINNNANNRIITGSGTANTLEAESTLTYDGTKLNVGTGATVSSVGNITAGIATFYGGASIFGAVNIISGTNTNHWTFTAGGNLEPAFNNFFSIGDGNKQVNNIYANNLIAGGTVTIADTIVHKSDTNTKIRFPADDTITAETGGSERLRIHSNGNVTIGSATFDTGNFGSVQGLNVYGTQPLVLVNATGNGTSFFMGKTSSTCYFGTSDAQNINFRVSDLDKMILDSSGRLLIGTTTEGSSVADDLTIAGSGDVGITIRSGSSSEGSIMFSDGTSGSDEYRGWINYNQNSNFMRFFTNATERLRITSTGLMGLGTNSPSDALEISHASDPAIRLHYGSNSGYSVISMDSANNLTLDVDAASAGSSSLFKIKIDAAEKFRINQWGGVGIRTDLTTSYGVSIAGASGAAGASLHDSGGLILQPTDAFFATGRIYPAIVWSGNTNSLARARAGITAVSMNSNDASSIIFMTRHAANGTSLTSDDERFRISDTGKISVGNGTSSWLNNDTDGDRVSLKVGNQLHISGGGNANFRQGIYNNCRGQGQANFYQGSIAASGGDYRASAVTFAYGGVQVWNDDGNNTNYAAGAQITTMSQNWQVDNRGYVLSPKQPCFMAHSNGASHIDIPSNAGNDYVFTTEVFDQNSNYNTSNGRFTAPVAGKYVFGIQIYAGFSISGVRVMHARFKKNGGDEYGTDIFGGTSNAGGTSYHPTGVGTVMYTLAANDYVTWNVGTFAGSGTGSKQIYGSKSTRFWGYLVA